MALELVALVAHSSSKHGPKVLWTGDGLYSFPGGFFVRLSFAIGTIEETELWRVGSFGCWLTRTGCDVGQFVVGGCIFLTFPESVLQHVMTLGNWTQHPLPQLFQP